VRGAACKGRPYRDLLSVPEGLDEEQMEEFERLIEQWIAPYDDAI
jgi:hypothetical protein